MSSSISSSLLHCIIHYFTKWEVSPTTSPKLAWHWRNLWFWQTVQPRKATASVVTGNPNPKIISIENPFSKRVVTMSKMGINRMHILCNIFCWNLYKDHTKCWNWVIWLFSENICSFWIWWATFWEKLLSLSWFSCLLPLLAWLHYHLRQ